jgi:hypothetical protein
MCANHHNTVSEATKRGRQGEHSMPSTDKICHMLAAVFFGVFSTAAIGAHPLEIAADEAATLCAKIGINSLDGCAETVAPSPDRPAAKAALQRMYKARTAFMQECDTGRGTLRKCQEQADLYIWTGILRGEPPWTVEYLDRVPPSAARR